MSRTVDLRKDPRMTCKACMVTFEFTLADIEMVSHKSPPHVVRCPACGTLHAVNRIALESREAARRGLIGLDHE